MGFCVVNLGCKVNRVESDAVAAALIARGFEPAAEEAAGLIVVNTCTVTGEAEKKTRKAVRHALRANEQAVVVVTGCAVAIDAAAYEALDSRVRVVPKGDLAASVERGEWDEAAGRALAKERPLTQTSPAELPIGSGFRTRVGVKVQDGCNNACTYCIVHVARGRAVSRPADDVMAECVRLAAAGAKEIVLTGINLGSYCCGQRRSPDAVRLADLLRRLLRETAELHGADEPPCRFRVSSIEPRDVDDDLIELMANAGGRICRHLHLPLQAGSSRVLREMARPYDAAFYESLVGRLRAAMPSLSLSTDIIVGFPGETADDFQETLAMAKRCGFSKIHVFPYSRREGTPAAARADQVPPEVKARRAAELRALGDELRARDLEARAGSEELALVEESGVAMTESYHEVPPPAGAPAGALVAVSL